MTQKLHIGTIAQAKMRSRGGFSFVETLVALLIFVGMTTIVCAGIPAAFDAYQRVTNSSNAQLALATTTAALRDELGLAVDVKKSAEGDVYYQTSDGYWVRIDNPVTTDGEIGLVKHCYKDTAPSFDPDSVDADDAETITLIPNSAIASAMGSDALVVRMEGDGKISYDSGVFSVPKLVVMSGNQELPEQVEKYEVRAILAPTVTG